MEGSAVLHPASPAMTTSDSESSHSTGPSSLFKTESETPSSTLPKGRGGGEDREGEGKERGGEGRGGEGKGERGEE